MISPIFVDLLIYLILSVFGWTSYSYLRPRATQNNHYQKLFLLQLVYCVAIMAGIPYLVAKHFGVNNLLFDASLFTMSVAIILHHVSIISRKIRLHGLISEKMHHKISHLLLFIPWGLAGISGGFSFWPFVHFQLDLFVFLIWFVETEVFAILGLATAIKDINWFERK